MNAVSASWTGPLVTWFAGPGGVVLIILAVWSIAWKGWALWKSARLNSKIWFIVLLIVNTVGILEILYIFVFSKMGKKQAAEGGQPEQPQ